MSSRPVPRPDRSEGNGPRVDETKRNATPGDGSWVGLNDTLFFISFLPVKATPYPIIHQAKEVSQSSRAPPFFLEVGLPYRSILFVWFHVISREPSFHSIPLG